MKRMRIAYIACAAVLLGMPGTPRGELHHALSLEWKADRAGLDIGLMQGPVYGSAMHVAGHNQVDEVHLGPGSLSLNGPWGYDFADSKGLDFQTHRLDYVLRREKTALSVGLGYDFDEIKRVKYYLWSECLDSYHYSSRPCYESVLHKHLSVRWTRTNGWLGNVNALRDLGGNRVLSGGIEAEYRTVNGFSYTESWQSRPSLSLVQYREFDHDAYEFSSLAGVALWRRFGTGSRPWSLVIDARWNYMRHRSLPHNVENIHSHLETPDMNLPPTVQFIGSSRDLHNADARISLGELWPEHATLRRDYFGGRFRMQFSLEQATLGVRGGWERTENMFVNRWERGGEYYWGVTERGGTSKPLGAFGSAHVRLMVFKRFFIRTSVDLDFTASEDSLGNRFDYGVGGDLEFGLRFIRKRRFLCDLRLVTGGMRLDVAHWPNTTRDGYSLGALRVGPQGDTGLAVRLSLLKSEEEHFKEEEL